MGRRGALPKQYPENVAVLRADVSHSSPAVPTRKLRPKAPLKPTWLTPFGKRVWDRVVAELEPLGLLSPVDRDILAAYCDMASFAKQERDHLFRHGVTQVGQRGEQIASARWRVYRDAVGQLDSLGTKLALNPSARLRMLHDLDDLDLGDDLDLD